MKLKFSFTVLLLTLGLLTPGMLAQFYTGGLSIHRASGLSPNTRFPPGESLIVNGTVYDGDTFVTSGRYFVQTVEVPASLSGQLSCPAAFDSVWGGPPSAALSGPTTLNFPYWLELDISVPPSTLQVTSGSSVFTLNGWRTYTTAPTKESGYCVRFVYFDAGNVLRLIAVPIYFEVQAPEGSGGGGQEEPAKPTQVTLSAAPNPVAPGANVDFTLSVKEAESPNNPVANGLLQLERRVRDDQGTLSPVGCSASEAFWDVDSPLAANQPASDGTFAAGLPAPVLPGTYGYRGRFLGTSAHEASETLCLDLVVPEPQTGECESPLTIQFGTVGSGQMTESGDMRWTVALKAKACQNASQVTSQGGVNAQQGQGSIVFAGDGVSQQDGNYLNPVLRRATGGNNQIWIWQLGNLIPNEEKELTIQVTKPLPRNYSKECGTAKYPMQTDLLGSWDISYIDEMGKKVKADATPEVKASYPACVAP